MTLRNGPAGYGWLTKALHWLTVLAVAAQFTVGYLMDADDSGRGRGRGRSGESGRGRGGEGSGYLDDPETLLRVHVALGLTILLLAVVRLGWRRVAGLPPWSEYLSEGQRRLAHWTERALLALLFVVPLSGLALVAAGDDDVLPLHVGAHLAFYVALAAHLFTNLRPRVLRRML
ncbi:cytochrome b [Nocardioides sp. GXQ0305]|uniref:cytochrome b n=1 Tax=Nocardioides sp. GXQ0305 TaxID=3423912 RepID=UPI003D7C554A